LKANRRRLLLKLDFEEGKRFGCPQCGKLCPIHDTSTKRWRHLNFFHYECLLEARVPRSNCPEHGVLNVAVPWAREGSGFTLLFEALALLLCREMPMAAVADTLGEHDTRLWRVAAHYVEAAHAQNSWGQVRTISVDETSARRGHRYVSNVLDAQTHELLLMVEGRSAQALEAFAQALVAHGGKVERTNAELAALSRGSDQLLFLLLRYHGPQSVLGTRGSRLVRRKSVCAAEPIATDGVLTNTQ
jgi:transposase